MDNGARDGRNDPVREAFGEPVRRDGSDDQRHRAAPPGEANLREPRQDAGT
jgi:hypothetical protein